MKKIFIISAIIILILAIIIGFIYFYASQKHDISDLSSYYKNLAKECESKKSYSCCMASVNTMAGGNYQLIPETECPKGYQPNVLECIDSFKWCEPSDTCAREGKTIGAQGMPNTCCFGLKPIGGWPGGYTGDCSIPSPPAGLSICSNCGDNFCNIDTGENNCNCAEDCN